MKLLTDFKFKADEKSFAAGKTARKGYKRQKRLVKQKEELAKIKEIMANGRVVTYTVLFFLVVIIELLLSFEIYNDLISRNVGSLNSILPGFLVAGTIVLMAAVASHLISLFYSPTLRDVELNKMLQRGLLLEEAKRKLTKRVNNNFAFGVVLASFTLGLVYALSNSRIADYELINADITYNYIDLFAPIIFVGLEITFGIFLYHGVSRMILEIMMNRSKKQLAFLKDECHHLTKLAVEYHEKSGHHKPSVELREALYRFKHRSIANDNYLDPISPKELPNHHHHLNSKSLAS